MRILCRLWCSAVVASNAMLIRTRETAPWENYSRIIIIVRPIVHTHRVRFVSTDHNVVKAVGVTQQMIASSFCALSYVRVWSEVKTNRPMTARRGRRPPRITTFMSMNLAALRSERCIMSGKWSDGSKKITSNKTVLVERTDKVPWNQFLPI